MIVSRLFTAGAATVCLMAGVAQAEDFTLTSAERETVVHACQLGLPLIPVESDFGNNTGQFALPIADRNGEVHTALIVEEASLRGIPECRAEIEDAVARRDEESDTRSS